MFQFYTHLLRNFICAGKIRHIEVYYNRDTIFQIAFLRVISLSTWAWQREITSRRGIYEAPLPVTARTPVLFIFIGLFFYISSAPVTQPQFSALFNSGQSLLSRQYRSGGINRDWKSLISLWRTTRRPRDDVILICNSEEVGHASSSKTSSVLWKI